MCQALAMPFLRVGDQSIPYELTRSPRAKRLRITVRPGRVRVTAPRFTPSRTVTAFVESKKHWIDDKVRSLRGRGVALPERFVDGARIMFRGRRLRLRIERIEGSRGSLRFASAFVVSLPRRLAPEEAESRARRLVMDWLARRALDDARRWSRRYGDLLGVHPARIRLGNQRSLWGSCSRRGVIALNWRLIATPKPIFEYVVVHELCHLREHNHGSRFWTLVESLMPDYRERRAWLKRNGVALD